MLRPCAPITIAPTPKPISTTAASSPPISSAFLMVLSFVAFDQCVSLLFGHSLGRRASASIGGARLIGAGLPHRAMRFFRTPSAGAGVLDESSTLTAIPPTTPPTICQSVSRPPASPISYVRPLRRPWG